ncbi:MAG: hypothetical protein JO156_09530, partial [Solirubrobacterales bacterium]|nr:hypothetical protein [Solirubrobacterales bacterium]
MSFIRTHTKLLLVAASCAILGAGASAIASAGAATGASSATPKRAALLAGPRRWAARAVHGELVLATKTGFVTATFDRGAVQSVNGQVLTITEGTKAKTYKTVSLTIPGGAKVRDDGKPGTL